MYLLKCNRIITITIYFSQTFLYNIQKSNANHIHRKSCTLGKQPVDFECLDSEEFLVIHGITLSLLKIQYTVEPRHLLSYQMELLFCKMVFENKCLGMCLLFSKAFKKSTVRSFLNSTILLH